MRTIKMTVWIQTIFEGFHRWKDAPDDVDFLREYHRHIFEVKLGMVVTHDNRSIEFFRLKKKVDNYISKNLDGKRFEFSCEMIAMQLLNQFDACFVEVSEDGENGATVAVVDGEETINIILSNIQENGKLRKAIKGIG